MKKIKVWDSNLLSEVYVTLEQIYAIIDQIGQKSGAQSLNDLPPSLVPTYTLYEICVAYDLLYNKILEHDLLVTGNTAQQSTLH